MLILCGCTSNINANEDVSANAETSSVSNKEDVATTNQNKDNQPIQENQSNKNEKDSQQTPNNQGDVAEKATNSQNNTLPVVSEADAVDDTTVPFTNADKTTEKDSTGTTVAPNDDNTVEESTTLREFEMPRIPIS